MTSITEMVADFLFHVAMGIPCSEAIASGVQTFTKAIFYILCPTLFANRFGG
jgi:hypothetical protein